MPGRRRAERVACDAMCGGLARWLRMFGVDTWHEPRVADAELVERALGEQRLVISSDHKLFERRVFATGQLAGLHLPVGLKLEDQVRYVAPHVRFDFDLPRCPGCNAVLVPAARRDVADVVPARSLIWATSFYRCPDCAHVYWDGTHWRRIEKLARELGARDEG